MNHYLDISLKPDAEIQATVLMNAICAKMHKLLHDLHSTTIGISFPKYDVTLGCVLRLHGSEADLKRLQGMTWLGGMTGYCKAGDVLPVPVNAKHRTVGRKQATMSQSKLNRLLKRGSITDDKVKAYKAKMFAEKGLDNPYLDLVSASNGQRHRRYIELGELQDQPVAGEFDLFGLSKDATVPWF
jgi:CRISPR-associated endonuclease Csy4